VPEWQGTFLVAKTERRTSTISGIWQCGEDEAPADSSSPETCELSPQLTTSTLKKNTTR